MISSLIKSFIFGIIEGLTEFLPISSTGHLILLNSIMKLSDNVIFTNIFEVVIQSGAILAVILLYFKKLWPIKKGFSFDKEKLNLWLYIIIAFFPAMVFGFLLKDIIAEKLFNPITVSITLIFYGIILIIIEKYLNKTKIKNIESQNLTVKIAFIIGLFQVLAMIPGTSRSAATIIGGLIVGLSREDAAEFSFFLAIPTIIGAGLFSLLDAKISFTNEMIYILIVGFLTSFLFAIIVIKAFIRFIQKHSFNLFGWYRIILGILIIALLII